MIFGRVTGQVFEQWAEFRLQHHCAGNDIFST
jgi:hypothetical protein